MLNKKLIISFFLVAAACFFFGYLAFAYYKELFIIVPLNYKNNDQISGSVQSEKKTIAIYFYKNDKWLHEDCDIMFDTTDQAHNLETIVRIWLNVLDEENLFAQRVSLVFVVLRNKLAYISFDGSIFQPTSTYQKLKILESFFKTIEPYFPELQVYFMMHQEALSDYHLDFSNPWRREFI